MGFLELVYKLQHARLVSATIASTDSSTVRCGIISNSTGDAGVPDEESFVMPCRAHLTAAAGGCTHLAFVAFQAKHVFLFLCEYVII